MNCIVEGCTNDPRSRYTLLRGRICEEHWRKLSLALRQEYWGETEYGKLEPSGELVQHIREYLDADTRKLNQAQDQSSPQ